jgi:hypothetical protein
VACQRQRARVAIQIVNFSLRYGEGAEAVLPAGIILSAIVVCILFFTGWKGWQMLYREAGRGCRFRLKHCLRGRARQPSLTSKNRIFRIACKSSARPILAPRLERFSNRTDHLLQRPDR